MQLHSPAVYFRAMANAQLDATALQSPESTNSTLKFTTPPAAHLRWTLTPMQHN